MVLCWILSSDGGADDAAAAIEIESRQIIYRLCIKVTMYYSPCHIIMFIIPSELFQELIHLRV